MREAFFKLHLSILLAGFTGILGKLITLNEGLLVWYRIALAVVILLLIPMERAVKSRALVGMLGVGALIALHWVFFFGSIKASNVSIGVICFSATGFFTALLEPLVKRSRLSLGELLYSLIALSGILLVFHLDVRYRTGILLGIASALFAALFTIANKQVGQNHSPRTLLFYEMLGGLLCLSLLMPAYLHFFPVQSLVPGLRDLLYLLVFALCCTVWLYLLQIEALKTISAFTLNLSYNLEPVYSIILAMLFLGEATQLTYAFYIGLSLILLSVLLQTRKAIKQGK